MDYFNYQDGILMAEDVDLREIAEKYGTPCYVYSKRTIDRHFKAYDKAFGDHQHLICYAVKANSNLGVLSILAKLGAGFDIVSGGELARVIAAGGDANKVIFSGVGKTAEEIEQALEAKIFCFNVESEAELMLIDSVAGEFGRRAPISFRVNPDVDAQSHPYISTGLKENKFGIAMDSAKRLYRTAKALANVQVSGIDCHIGSQLTDTAPFVDALNRVLSIVDALTDEGIHLKHLDLGGGLGVRYKDETPPEPSEYVDKIMLHLGDRSLPIIIEPGRSIVANAGILLTKVEYTKHNEDKDFAIVDAAMNDMLRPALYDAWLDIIPVDQQDSAACRERVYDIVGPICETGDFLGKHRALGLARGSLLAIRSAGAYGFSMSSNYNSRNRAAEVMVDGDHHQLVRKRETIEGQMALESVYEN